MTDKIVIQVNRPSVSSLSKVSENAAHVEAIGNSIGQVQAVGDDLTGANHIGVVSADLTGPNTIGATGAIADDIEAVSEIAGDVTATAGISSDIQSAVAALADIVRVSANIDSISDVAEIIDGFGLAQYSSVTEMAAASAPQEYKAVFVGGSAGGLFEFLTGDQSANVTADPGKIVWVAPNSAPAGSSGCWKRLFSGPIDLRWSGLTADDSTDISTALERCAAICHRANASHVLIPQADGWWRLATPVDWVEHVALEVRGKIRVSVAAHTDILNARGTEGSAVSVTSVSSDRLTINIAAGAQTAFSVGEYLRIYSDDRYDPGRTNTKFAELRLIEAIGDGQLTVEAPLRTDYQTNVEVVPVHLFEGLHIFGSGVWDANPENSTSTTVSNERRGIHAFLCKNPIIEGQSAIRFDRRFIAIEDVVGGAVRNINIKDTYASSTGYGISIVGCSDFPVISDWLAENVRHAISTNNTSFRGGAPSLIAERGTIISSPLTIGGADTSPLDTHAATFEVIYKDIKIIGSSGVSVSIECPNATLENISVVGGSGAFIIRNKTKFDATYRLSNLRSESTNGTALRIDVETGANFGLTRIYADNIFIDKAGNVPVYISSDGPDALAFVSLSNIRITNSTEPSLGSICLDGAVRGHIRSCEIFDSKVAGLRAIDCYDLEVQDVHVVAGASGVEGFHVTATTLAGSDNVRFSRCSFDAGDQTGTTGLRIGNNPTGVSADDSNDFSNAAVDYNIGTGGGHRIPAEQTAISAVISSGSVSIYPDTKHLTIDNESSASTDDLDTISAATGHTLKAGHILVVQCASNSRDPTLKDGTGNMDLNGGDVTLADVDDTVSLIYDGSNWNRIA